MSSTPLRTKRIIPQIKKGQLGYSRSLRTWTAREKLRTMPSLDAHHSWVQDSIWTCRLWGKCHCLNPMPLVMPSPSPLGTSMRIRLFNFESRALLSKVVASTHGSRFQFKLIQMQYDEKVSSSIAVATFRRWRVTLGMRLRWTAQWRLFPSLQEVPLSSAGEAWLEKRSSDAKLASSGRGPQLPSPHSTWRTGAVISPR